jgi:hypothetical protein
MLKYNNTHIFTGYLKQLLSTFNLPACRIYTREFAQYHEQHGEEDPRVLASFNSINENRLAVRINYLKDNEISTYFWDHLSKQGYDKAIWIQNSSLYYDSTKAVHGLTRNLNSPGTSYDAKTHEYLGDYLRFLRDYHNVDLMTLYNCFNDKIYNNIDFSFAVNPGVVPEQRIKAVFNAQDPNYRIYAIPVKLFSKYTIAVDCDQGLEMFCGLYNTNLDMSGKSEDFAVRTYLKVKKTFFNQPFLYDKLDITQWPVTQDFTLDAYNNRVVRADKFTHWDIANREKDLRLIIKVPISCRSTITILEGDYRTFNDFKYLPVGHRDDGTTVIPTTITDGSGGSAASDIVKTTWDYRQNHNVLNFNSIKINPNVTLNNGDGIDLNRYSFKPVSKLQLLAFNTGESHPFADRLIEYLSGSAITPIDEIHDNIKRAQLVMNQNHHYFKIDGLWEPKMQNIIYDYMINSGPIVVSNGKLVDTRQGYHQRLGHASKSTLYDVIGYIDSDAEKLYASWKIDGTNAAINNNIQNADIYVDKNGNSLWDI